MTNVILDYGFGAPLATGQTDDLTPSGRTTKDDGGFQRGIVNSKVDAQYVVLTTGQYSGDTNITVNGKTDVHSNECVFDKATRLMWSRTVSAAVYGAGTEDLFWDESPATEDIFGYCDAANSAQLAGFSDWRVCNKYELFSLMIFEGEVTVPNTTAFPDWSPVYEIWCATTGPTNTAEAFIWRGNSTSQYFLRTKDAQRAKTLLCRLGIEQ